MTYGKLLINVSYFQMFLFHRKLGKLTKFIESQKEKFTQLDLQDVEVREKLKHSKSKSKKLQKQLQKDKEKVSLPHGVSPLRAPDILVTKTIGCVRGNCCMNLGQTFFFFFLKITFSATEKKNHLFLSPFPSLCKIEFYV